MTAATYQTLLANAKASIAAYDWATAENYLLQAQAELAGIADGSNRGGSLQMDRKTVEDLLRNVRAKLANSGSTTGRASGLKFGNVKYQNAGAE